MKKIRLFTGPGLFAQLVREELLARGIATDLQSETPLGRIYGSVGDPAGLQSVIVTEEVAEGHRAEIDEVLTMVSAAVTEAPPESGGP